jgi:hypothetical protein
MSIDKLCYAAEDEMRVMQFSAIGVRARYAAVAGVVVVLAALWITMPTVNETPKSPQAVASGVAGTAGEFKWESPLQAARYRITLRDSKDVLIFTGETGGSPFRPDAALKSKLRTGETYTWKVESLDASGSVIAQSMPVTFRYQP